MDNLQIYLIDKKDYLLRNQKEDKESVYYFSYFEGLIKLQKQHKEIILVIWKVRLSM